MIPLVVSLAAGFVLSCWLAVGYRRAAGTTLRAPIAWQAVAMTAVIGVDISLSLSADSGALASVWRYVAAVGTFCPAMALLGAKRPQDQGWQFVVATLWVVLSLPAFQSLVFAPASRLELHWAWQVFLMLLIVVTLTNYVATRNMLPALLLAISQTLLVQTHLPILWQVSERWAVATALSCMAAAATIVGFGPRVGPRAATWSDRAWLDFRNTFGAVWALRVMERINQAARQSGRAEVLRWQGFVAGWDPLAEREAAGQSLTMTIRMLLRRFVNVAWLERRRLDATRE